MLTPPRPPTRRKICNAPLGPSAHQQLLQPENAKEGEENGAEADEAAAERRNHALPLHFLLLLLRFLAAVVVGAPPALGGARHIVCRVSWALRRQYFV